MALSLYSPSYHMGERLSHYTYHIFLGRILPILIFV